MEELACFISEIIRGGGGIDQKEHPIPPKYMRPRAWSQCCGITMDVDCLMMYRYTYATFKN